MSSSGRASATGRAPLSSGMTIAFTITSGVLAGLAAMGLTLMLRPRTASAHCDTMDGPAVKDGQFALQTGNVDIALKWVHEDGADALTRIFDRAQAARRLGEEARLVADQWFLENLVRILDASAPILRTPRR